MRSPDNARNRFAMSALILKADIQQSACHVR